MTLEKANDAVFMLEAQLKTEKENYRKALTSYKEFGKLKHIKQRIKSINSMLFAIQQAQELNSRQ